MALIPAMIRSTTPLLLTALGGMLSERSGVVNIALEGMILFGALTAAVVAHQLELPFLAGDPTVVLPWIPWLAVLAAAGVGGGVAALYGWICLWYRADQIVTGTAINLLALSVPSLILQVLYNNATSSAPVRNRLPLWFGYSPLVYLAFLLVPLLTWFLFRSVWGLRLRVVGEYPQAAASVGIPVIGLRFWAVVASGVLAGLAGAFLSLGFLNQFVRGMSAGKGFIALAAMIFGQWHPLGILGATLLFGLADAWAIQLEGQGILPAVVTQAIPFLVTMLVLAGVIRRSHPPAALGKPYD
ncbi:MAG: ABC transporter permease [Thermostichales cyanobacterium SZTDM-1c_bins_54]